MSNNQQAAQGSAAPVAKLKYKQMNVVQKIGHLGKVCIFFLTLGFAYPNIFND